MNERPLWYTLDENKNAIPATMEEYHSWAYTTNEDCVSCKTLAAIVGQDIIRGMTVSTVFLGLDHGFPVTGSKEDSRPVVFETMVFVAGTYQDEAMWRCCTWAEAEEQHKEAIAFVKAMPWYRILQMRFSSWWGSSWLKRRLKK